LKFLNLYIIISVETIKKVAQVKNIEELKKQRKSLWDEIGENEIQLQILTPKHESILISRTIAFNDFKNNPNDENKEKWMKVSSEEFDMKQKITELTNKLTLLKYKQKCLEADIKKSEEAISNSQQSQPNN
jgi:hypothetical protein